MPAPLHPLPVEFYAATDGGICMTVEAYQNLARNLADVTRWVQEARWRLDYYGAAK